MEKVEEKKIPRVLTSSELANKKFKTYDFSEPHAVYGDKFHQAFGTPQTTGTWFVWGASGNGKTSFILQLADYLSSFERVLLVELEEGGLTTQQAFQRVGIHHNNNLWICFDDLETLNIRLKKHKSPRVVLVNSFQYLFKTYTEYQDLKKRFPNKLFIFISQARGRFPIGRPAVSCQFDADLKIWVE